MRHPVGQSTRRRYTEAELELGPALQEQTRASFAKQRSLVVNLRAVGSVDKRAVLGQRLDRQMASRRVRASWPKKG